MLVLIKWLFPSCKKSMTEFRSADVTECHWRLPYCLTIASVSLFSQVELGMDEEKLLRMKRRKEKNRECSRQFRLKQKDKEQRLTLGKIEKSKTLDNMKRNVAKLKTILSKISQKCSGCPKASMLLNQHLLGGDKENINPNLAQDFLELCQ